MSTIVVTIAPELARKRPDLLVARDDELHSLVHELGGEIEHSIMYQDNTLEFHVAIADGKVELLLARLSTSDGFRWKEP
jgi:hypothetical protein